jgi:thioredoxin 2
MSFSRKVTCPYCGAVERIPAEQFNDQLKCGSCHRAMFAARPMELTAAEFAEKIAGSDIPVLVDFWAPWCGPCTAMAPAFEKAAIAMESRVVFARLNTDDEQQIAQQFDIRSIPTMILFRDGKVVARHSGAMMGGEIEKWVTDQLSQPAITQ